MVAKMIYSLGRTAEENLEEMMEVGSQLYKVITRKMFYSLSKLFVVSRKTYHKIIV